MAEQERLWLSVLLGLGQFAREGAQGEVLAEEPEGSGVRLSASRSRPYHVLGVWSPLATPLLCAWVSLAEKW